MNVTDLGNDTFTGNLSSVEHANVHPQWISHTLDITGYVILALGIPGNILSAIIWLRCHAANKNPSAIHLAALAISDLVFQLSNGVGVIPVILAHYYFDFNHILARCLWYMTTFAVCLEPLLLLSFSAVRLTAIRQPLQVYYCKQSSQFKIVFKDNSTKRAKGKKVILLNSTSPSSQCADK